MNKIKNKIKKDINYLCNPENYYSICNKIFSSADTFTILSSTNTFYRKFNGNLSFESYSKMDENFINVEMYQDRIILRRLGFYTSIIEDKVMIKYNCTEEEFFQLSTLFNMYWFEYKLIKKFEKIKNMFIKERE